MGKINNTNKKTNTEDIVVFHCFHVEVVTVAKSGQLVTIKNTFYHYLTNCCDIALYRL